MKKLVFFTFLTVLFFGCQTKEKNTETAQESEPVTTTDTGWVKLFDGKTKNGWHIYNGKSDGSDWEVKDGVLHLNPKEILVTPVQGAGDLTRAVNGGDLATDEEYDNFLSGRLVHQVIVG